MLSEDVPGSGHELVTSTVALRVSKPFINCKRYTVERVEDQATRDVFRIELRNKFEVLNKGRWGRGWKRFG